MDVNFKINIDGNTNMQLLAEPNSVVQWFMFYSKVSYKEMSALRLLLSRLGFDVKYKSKFETMFNLN